MSEANRQREYNRLIDLGRKPPQNLIDEFAPKPKVKNKNRRKK